MKCKSAITTATYATLTACAIGVFVLPDELGIPESWAAPSKNEIRITGIVRDFRADHPDFGVDPAAEYGHRAGLVELTLGPDQQPVHDVPAGFEVDTQWYDKSANPIPPHLYRSPIPAGSGGPSVVHLKNSPTTQDNPVIDTFCSCDGPYGAGPVGSAPTIRTGTPMPSVTVPSISRFVSTYAKPGGTHNITSSFRCRDLDVTLGATIRIHGDITIVAEEKFTLTNSSRILLQPDSTLTVYALKDLYIQDGAQLNANTYDSNRATIYLMSNGVPGFIQNQGQAYASVVAPDTWLQVQDRGDLYGQFTGEGLHIQNRGGLHIDTAVGSPFVPAICGILTNDIAGVAGRTSTAAITSAASYDTWFKDDMGTNLSASHTITLTDNGSGIYEYSTPTFHPIDDQLFGNEEAEHNYNLTFCFSATFIFDECTGQFFEFEGDDDAWAFIGDDLGLDLGGITPGTHQRLEIDRFESLVDGEAYTFRFFYAQRQGSYSRFSIRTNLPLKGATALTVSSGFD